MDTPPFQCGKKDSFPLKTPNKTHNHKVSDKIYIYKKLSA